MRRTPARASAMIAVIAALALGSVAGCAPTSTEPDPEPSESSDTPTPTPSETSAAGVTRVVIDGDSIDVVDGGGSTTLTLTFDGNPLDAATALDGAIGEKSVTATITDDACFPTVDTISWGGLHLWSSVDGVNKPENAQFFVTADEATTTNGTPIVIPSGQGVGASEDEVLNANITAPSYASGDGFDLYYDVISGTPDGDPSQFFGAMAQVVGGEVTQIVSPAFFLYEC